MSVGIYSWPKTNTSLLLASCWFHYSWKGACSVIKHAIGFSVLHAVIVLTSSERVDMPSLISPSLSVDFQVWSGSLFLHGNATCHFNHIVKVYPCISHLLSNLFPGVVKWESYIHTLIYIYQFIEGCWGEQNRLTGSRELVTGHTLLHASWLRFSQPKRACFTTLFLLWDQARSHGLRLVSQSYWRNEFLQHFPFWSNQIRRFYT